PSERFFNHSVAAARLEDFLSLYALHVKQRTMPRWIVLVVDPWLLNPTTTGWFRGTVDYQAMCVTIGIVPRPLPTAPPALKYAELFSPVLLQTCCSAMERQRRQTASRLR